MLARGEERVEGTSKIFKHKLKAHDITPPYGGFKCYDKFYPTIQMAAQMSGLPYEDGIIKVSIETAEYLSMKGAHDWVNMHCPKLSIQASQYGGKITPVDLDETSPCPYNYNSSVVKYLGRMLLAYRAENDESGSWIYITEIDSQYQPTGENIKVNFPVNHPDNQFEDPRLQIMGGKLFLSVSFWEERKWSYHPQQRLFQLSESLEVVSEWPLEYGKNGRTGVEKNWVFFDRNNFAHGIYTYHPFTVFDLSSHGVGGTVKYVDGFKWSYGQIRGGTPPVLIDNEYWLFFHSSMRDTSLRYYMGVAVFDIDFNPKRMTKIPLLCGTDLDPFKHWKPLVVFPSGLVYDNGKFIVSMGVNDLWTAIAEYNKTDIDKVLVNL
jgi:predicted GH43/DUF377 family glycosyl hydrolase